MIDTSPEKPGERAYYSRLMKDRGQGRKPINASGELMKPRQIRMTDEEWEKCRRLGGAAWVRAQIKKAKEQP